MNYSVLSRLQWISLDTNIIETMSRKTGGKKIVLVRVDMAPGHPVITRSLIWILGFPLAACRSVLEQDTEPATAPDEQCMNVCVNG